MAFIHTVGIETQESSREAARPRVVGVANATRKSASRRYVACIVGTATSAAPALYEAFAADLEAKGAPSRADWWRKTTPKAGSQSVYSWHMTMGAAAKAREDWAKKFAKFGWTFAIRTDIVVRETAKRAKAGAS